ncbi:molecular chaperone DnaK [Campylobacter sp. RM16190]|uniref:molecular chaperone DnaK n=1 Tax=Campylobacter sp. RM16190 TaxID=1705727 RepID=UPI00201E313A|nr:molecular chaperone DnaK [Campylobacter sp. RM16190]
MSEVTKQIKGLKVSREMLEADINLSWQKFINTDNKESSNNLNYMFLKNIENLYNKFNELVSANSLISIGNRSFFMPEDNIFIFIHKTEGEEYEEIYKAVRDYIGDEYSDIKFEYEVLEKCVKAIYDNLPVLRDDIKEYTSLASDIKPITLAFGIKQTTRKLIIWKLYSSKYGYYKEGGSYVKSECIDFPDYWRCWDMDIIPAEKFSPKDIFNLCLKSNLEIKELASEPDYKILQGFKFKDNKFIISDETKLEIGKDYLSYLLNEDKIRADIKEYDEKMLSDVNRGLWELWEMDQDSDKNTIFIPFESSLTARNPESSIKNGVIGIDFGTKSTVVVYQEDTVKINPMRIGVGDLGKKVEKSHFENPTIISFENFGNFIKDYRAKQGRPYTKWRDVNISHTAENSLKNAASGDFNSYLMELKQWAGAKNRKLKIFDKKRAEFEIKGSLELGDNDINPIEIYAYYLGLYINNQHNGIFLDYILSFPVTYEVKVRQMILSSFKKGIIKSLPDSLQRAEILDRLNVIEGASEPAAYAVMALEEYGFDPVGDERVYYGVFDFGGGTTDFDFGVYKELDTDRYDYCIEHFGAGGDMYLGGENLLELISFEVFKSNKDKLLEAKIPFIKPDECEKFPGSEILLQNSQEAKRNTKELMEKLRPLWEGMDDESYDSGVLSINLFNSRGENIPGFELNIDKNEILSTLENRIKLGVDSFFNELRKAIVNYEANSKEILKINEFNIFLAGNSSKSAFVTKLFNERIEKEKQDMLEKASMICEFKLFRPLGENNDDIESPNGKTGVAFGLIRSRKGGRIQVIDRNVDDVDINFKYYLGRIRKRCFQTVIYRNQKYNEWVKFINADESKFEIFYTTLASATTNKMNIDENSGSIKKLALETGFKDDGCNVYIRLISPSEFEYVVSDDDGIKNEVYKTEIKKGSI